MAEAENCRGECGGGLLVDITVSRVRQRRSVKIQQIYTGCRVEVEVEVDHTQTHHCVRHLSGLGGEAAGKC